MFRCQSCRTVTRPREPQNTVVVETRPVNYRKMVEEVVEHEDENGVILKEKLVTDKVIGTGWEVVREAKVCNNCVSRFVNA